MAWYFQDAITYLILCDLNLYVLMEHIVTSWKWTDCIGLVQMFGKILEPFCCHLARSEVQNAQSKIGPQRSERCEVRRRTCYRERERMKLLALENVSLKKFGLARSCCFCTSKSLDISQDMLVYIYIDRYTVCSLFVGIFMNNYHAPISCI